MNAGRWTLSGVPMGMGRYVMSAERANKCAAVVACYALYVAG